MRTVCRAMIAAGLGMFAIAAHAAEQAPLNSVTVEAERYRADLEKKVHTFVTSLMVNHHAGWSNSRWTDAICPAVEGLPPKETAFVSTRILQTAKASGAILGRPKCTPNLVIYLTRDPDALLQEWISKNMVVYQEPHGLGPLHRFMETPRPVRVMYNAYFFTRPSGSRLRYDSVRSLDSVIVVVDLNQLGGTNFAQLADYLSLVSLSEIDFDKDHGDAPTILSLFSNPDGTPHDGMSAWDRAFLKSLYTTNLDNQLQDAEMTVAMTDALAPR